MGTHIVMLPPASVRELFEGTIIRSSGVQIEVKWIFLSVPMSLFRSRMKTLSGRI